MKNRFSSKSLQGGFSLVDALVSVVIVGFGMLALVGIQTKITMGTDAARQRAEAMRLAQEKIEYFRSFTGISTGTVNWNALTTSTSPEAISGYTLGEDTGTTNTTFNRTWTVGGANTDAVRPVTVTVSWKDRYSGSTDNQSVTLTTSIAKVDPKEAAYLGYPLPQNTTLKRPKNRNLNIPLEAVSLGGGESMYYLGSTLQIVFSDNSGYVIKKCTSLNQSGSNYNSGAGGGCTTYNGYILAGYISGNYTNTSGLGMNLSSLTGTTAGACKFGDATNINNQSQTISGYKYYICVVQVASQGGAYSGTVRLGGVTVNSTNKVCRFEYAASDYVDSNERNVQPYANVSKSLDNQNYYIDTAGNCDSITTTSVAGGTVSTTLHQDCRTSQSPTTTATGTCPLSSYNAPTTLP